MAHSITLPEELVHQVLWLINNPVDTGRPLFGQNGNTPSGTTHAELESYVVKELTDAITATVYTTRQGR